VLAYRSGSSHLTFSGVFMSRLQKLFGCLLILLLLTSLSGNVALFYWVRHQARLAAEQQAQIESLRREMRDLRRQLREIRSSDPALHQETMDTLAGQTEALRELEPLAPVARRLVSQEEMAQLILQELEAEYSFGEAQQDEVVLSTLELIPPDLDLYQMINDLLEEGVAGLYVPDDETLTVVIFHDGMGPLEKSTFAHEYTHALQDQHFDLEALGMGSEETNRDDDQLTAIQGLVEGDATFMMQQYMSTYLTPVEMLGLIGEAMSVDQEVLNRAPRYLRESLLFPYREGLLFVTSLYQQGGWSATNAAYTHPPQSTEQIMHPERYPTPQVVTLPPLTDTLGSGWQLADENVLGEFTLRAYLDVHLTRGQAAKAAQGWDGDRYAVYQNGGTGQDLLVLSLVWDSEAEAAEFVGAYLEYAQARFGDGPYRTDGDARMRWTGEEDVLLLAQRSDRDGPARTLIVLAPDETLVERVLREFPGY
jgi:hypothetical protein